MASALGLRFYRICVKQNLYVSDGWASLLAMLRYWFLDTNENGNPSPT